MTIVLGVDGCPHGWCAVAFDTKTHSLTPAHHSTFQSVLESLPRATLAIDVPIGLLDCEGGRDCDREARRFLGPRRASSVFPPPARKTLRHCGRGADLYRKACESNIKATGKAISQQAFWIGPKIREVDQAMTRALERRVCEAHPEVSFAAMNGGNAMCHRKSTSKGRQERWAVLRRIFGQLPALPARPPELGRTCDLEDYIDAIACAWTAKCIAEGEARSFPAKPPRDAEGLRMAIWAPR